MSTPTYTMNEGLRALSAVQKFFPGAILAGGYLRDAVCQRSPKDIDIFVNAHSLWNVVDFEREMSATKMVMCEYMERGEVQTIWDVQGFALPVQVIMLKNGLDAIDRAAHHDFGICQAWHTGAELFTTEDFKRDFLNRQFTLVHCEDSTEFKRSIRRWLRLSPKFPEFDLVVPDKYQHYREEVAA